MNAARIIVDGIAIGLLVCLVVGLCPNAIVAQTNNEILPESEITVEKVKTFFDAAFLKCEIDKDYDLIIQEGGVVALVTVDMKKKLLMYHSYWPMKSNISETEKLRFVNKLNSTLICVRFYMRISPGGQTELICDYQLPFENGITAYQVVTVFRTYIRVIQGGLSRMDNNDILGRDESEQPPGAIPAAPAPLPAAPKADPSA